MKQEIYRLNTVPCAMCGGTGRIDPENNCAHCRSARIRAGLTLDGSVYIPEMTPICLHDYKARHRDEGGNLRCECGKLIPEEAKGV